MCLCGCVHVYVHAVGSQPDLSFMTQAHILSAAREIGRRLLTAQVSLAIANRERKINLSSLYL